MDKKFKSKIDRFYAQKRFALIGVSPASGHEASAINFKRLEDVGLEVYPVNPNRTEYLGHQCYKNVASIDVPVDAVMIFTNPEITAEVVKECYEAGVKNIWIHNGLGNGSRSKEATAFLADKHEINFIDGACPMMFGPPSDFFHKGVGKVLGWLHKLPA